MGYCCKGRIFPIHRRYPLNSSEHFLCCLSLCFDPLCLLFLSFSLFSFSLLCHTELGDSEEVRQAFFAVVDGRRHPKLLARMWEEAVQSKSTGPRSFDVLARTAAGVPSFVRSPESARLDVAAGTDVFVRALAVGCFLSLALDEF